MKNIAWSFITIGSVVTAGCAPTTVEEVGSFRLNGQNYVIKSTTPGNVSEADARERATSSVKVKGGTAYCDGSIEDCKAAVEDKIQALASDEGAYG